MRRKKRTGLKIAAVVVLAAIFGGLAFFAAQKEKELTAQENARIENAGAAVNAVQTAKTLTYEGKEYPLRKHVDTVLLIGTDSNENEVKDLAGMTDFMSYHQSDFLVLLAVDDDAKEVNIIQINRDTMTDVPWLDFLGNYGGTEFKQIALAFNYGSGKEDSCRNTCDAVSRFLYNAPVDRYIQLPMTSIGLLNDLVGGVTVTIEDDLTPMDETLVKGTTVKLMGVHAENFVRARMVLEDDTNLSRMRRQRTYFDGFQKSAKNAINTDSAFVMKAIEKMSSHLISDMTAQEMSSLITKLDAYQVNPASTYQGELKVNKYYEFYPDLADVWRLVKNALCE